MEAEDQVDPMEVWNAISRRDAIHPGLDRRFENQPIIGITVRQLRRMFERKDEIHAVGFLEKRSRIQLDEHAVIHSNDPALNWYLDNHYIDYVLLVSARIGLHAILPNSETNPGYTFRMLLSQHYKTFKPKFTRLGFDPAGRMLFFGYQGQDNVWLAMAPKAAFVAGSVHDHVNLSGEATTLSTKHYLSIISWLASMLSKRGLGQVWSRDPYLDITSLANLRAHTNIL